MGANTSSLPGLTSLTGLSFATVSGQTSPVLYSSGVSTIALSTGTLNFGQSRLVSARTLAASALTASAANTNVAIDECVFIIGGASGASLAINSGGTTYFFNSAGSAKNT